MVPEPQILLVGSDLDANLSSLANTAAVFVIHAGGRDPYLARTGMLRKRLLRLLGERAGPSRLLSLRSIAQRVEYWQVASRLESSILFYQLARQYFPDSYLEVTKLRMPAYVKLVLSNPYPRAHVTNRITGGPGYYFGPFRTRAGAEEFQNGMLDLFQLRRCQEDLEPSPEHPGCIYGEMNMCLRPCQQVVGPEEYASETQRVIEFLSTGGRSLLDSAMAARDRLSTELQFEEAARQHVRCERIEAAWKHRDDLATNAETLAGVAVTRSTDSASVELWFVTGGMLHSPHRFRVAPEEGAMKSLDTRLRDIVSVLPSPGPSFRDRQEHLALLARWFYSSWRDGEWLPFENGHPPYRRLVRAISRVAASSE
jgi:excinuclease UvrABC nuclease subunit